MRLKRHRYSITFMGFMFASCRMSVWSFLVYLYQCWSPSTFLYSSTLHILLYGVTSWFSASYCVCLGLCHLCTLNHFLFFSSRAKSPQQTLNAAGLPKERLGCDFFSCFIKSLKVDMFTYKLNQAAKSCSIQKHQKKKKERNSNFTW